MTTSGTISFTLTVAQVIQFAYQKLGLVRSGGTPTANELQEGIAELNAMLKEFAMEGLPIFTKTNGSFALTAATASYDLNTLPAGTPLQPLRIIQANYQTADATPREIPMIELSRGDYSNLPVKTTPGIPTQFFFDKQNTTATFYTWPVLASPTTEQINLIYQRRIQDAGSASDTLDIPQEWLSMVGYNLSLRLIPNYGLSDDVAKIVALEAQRLRQMAEDYERDNDVYFRPQRGYGG